MPWHDNIDALSLEMKETCSGYGSIVGLGKTWFIYFLSPPIVLMSNMAPLGILAGRPFSVQNLYILEQGKLAIFCRKPHQ
jgi:hypothetical protein